MAQQAGTDAQAAQTGLLTAIGPAIATAWGRVDLTDPTRATPALITLVGALVHKYAPASGTLAARYYSNQRRAAGLRGAFRVTPAPSPPAQQIAATVGWATAPLRQTEPDVTAAEARLTGAVERLVLNTGRLTLTNAVQADRQARGWARITRPGACSFCRLLATRGAVYKDEGSAGRDANSRFVGDGEFKWHNNCHCYIEPLFAPHYEPTAQARGDLALYREVTRGLSGAAARNAFRVAVDSGR